MQALRPFERLCLGQLAAVVATSRASLAAAMRAARITAIGILHHQSQPKAVVKKVDELDDVWMATQLEHCLGLQPGRCNFLAATDFMTNNRSVRGSWQRYGAEAALADLLKLAVLVLAAVADRIRSGGQASPVRRRGLLLWRRRLATTH